MTHKMWKRIGALLLSGAMVFTNPAIGALAEETVPIEGETGNAEEEEMTEEAGNEEEAVTEESTEGDAEDTVLEETETEVVVPEEEQIIGEEAVLGMRVLGTPMQVSNSNTDWGEWHYTDELYLLDRAFAIAKAQSATNPSTEDAIDIELLYVSASGAGVEITQTETEWLLKGTAVGSYIITVTYQDTEKHYSAKTTTFQLNVVDSIYSLELTSDSVKTTICPGETQTISAVARKEDTAGTAQIADYTIRWNVTAKEDVVTYTSDAKSITLCGVSEGNVEISAELLIDGKTVDVKGTYSIGVKDSYYMIALKGYGVESNFRLAAFQTESVTIEPQLLKFDSDHMQGQQVTETVSYRWDAWTPEDLVIQDAENKILDPTYEDTGKAPFTLTKKNGNWTDAFVTAVIPSSENETDHVAARAQVIVNWKELKLKYKGVENHTLITWSDQDVTVEADTTEFPETGWSMQWQFVYRDPNTGEAKVYDSTAIPSGLLTADGAKVTIHMAKLLEWKKTLNGNLGLQGILKLNDTELASEHFWIDQREKRAVYSPWSDEDELEVLPLTMYQYADGKIDYYIINEKHPNSISGQAQILEISSSDPSVCEVSQGEYGIRIYAVKEGQATITMKIDGPDGEETLRRTIKVVKYSYEVSLRRVFFCQGERAALEPEIYRVSAKSGSAEHMSEKVTAGYTVSYSDYDTNLLTIDENGMLTAGNNNGGSNLTVTAVIQTADGNTKTIQEKVKVNITDSCNEINIKNKALLSQDFYPGSSLTIQDLGAVLIEHTTEHPEGVEVASDIRFIDTDTYYASISEDGKTLHLHSDISNLPTTCSFSVSAVEDGMYSSICRFVLQIKEKHTHDLKAGKVISPATVFKEEQREYSCDCGYRTVVSVKNSMLKRSYTLTETSITLKTNQTVSGFQISGLAKGDFIKSIKLDNKKYAKLSKVDLKKGTFTIKALKKKGKANIYITLASPGKVIKVPVTIQTGKVKTSKVSLSEKALTLKKGASTVMTTTRKPFTSTEKITYKTSNKKVVKVTSQSGGKKVKLTAVAPGTAKITVKAGKKKAECTVTVPGIGNIKSSVTLKRKKSTTLKPKRYGIKGNVTYTSSNPAVAAVNAKGKITGVKKGTATITIKAGGYTATCKVKVK